MSLSEAQKLDAYREAQQILKMDEKWQELMPGERKPNFRRAAREIIRRALGHKVRRNQRPLNLHGGMMHEHDSREAALVERTLKNGMMPPHVLHRFQHGGPVKREVAEKPYDLGHDPQLPDFDVFVHDHGATEHYPSHFEPGTGAMHSSMHEVPAYHEVAVNAPQGTRLPSTYEAVH